MSATKMKNVHCKICRKNKHAQIPHKTEEGDINKQDACYDLYACENGMIQKHGGWKIVNIGIQLKVETPNTCFIIFSRSGLKTKNGVHIRGGPSIIDAEFHGTLTIPLQNDGEENFYYQKGDRLAQMAPLAVRGINWEEVETISEDGRGSYGSTGIK